MLYAELATHRNRKVKHVGKWLAVLYRWRLK